MELKKVAEGFFKPKIDVSKFFGFEEGEIVLTFREPTEEEFYQFTIVDEKDKAKRMDTLRKIWTTCLIDWTIEDEDEEKSDKKSVLEILQKSAPACMHITLELQNQLPFPKKSDGDSDKSPESISTADE